jgi:replication-associated recombination protein RarA
MKAFTDWNYSLFEVSSAFQKSVRRGLEEEAMYWAVELYNSKYDEYLWKRIKIITSEDVGLAEPTMPAVISGLYQNYVEQKKKKDTRHMPERLFLTHAVLLLCRAKKSRLVDSALMYYWGSHYEQRKPIPEFAFDKHNQQGRKMGRGWKHFFEEGTKLAPHQELEKEAEYKEKAQIYGPEPVPKPDDDVNRQGSFWVI